MAVKFASFAIIAGEITAIQSNDPLVQRPRTNERRAKIENAPFHLFRSSVLVQIQTKRELFFKGDSAIISSPSVPSVPPPQPPIQTPPNPQVNNSSATTNATTAGSLTSPNATPVYSSSTTLTGCNTKPRLPSAIPNDASEDSNRRESARTISSKEDSNKETSLLQHTRPMPPTKSKVLDGYVGFANLPNQVYRKAVKKGFEFTLMVVGGCKMIRLRRLSRRVPEAGFFLPSILGWTLSSM